MADSRPRFYLDTKDENSYFLPAQSLKKYIMAVILLVAVASTEGIPASSFHTDDW